MSRETTKIFVDNGRKQLGAAAYLAVLAYPNDLDRRSKFIEAAMASFLRSRPSTPTQRRSWGAWAQRVYKLRNRGHGRISLASKRISKRLWAARMACGVIAPRDSGLQILPVTDPPRSNDQPKLKIVIGAHWPSSAGVNQWAIWVANAAGISARKESEDGEIRFRGDDTKVKSIIWMESKPVLHLAIPILGILNETKGLGVLDLIFQPQWVPKALANAELWREMIIQSDVVDEQETIELLAEP